MAFPSRGQTILLAISLLIGSSRAHAALPEGEIDQKKSLNINLFDPQYDPHANWKAFLHDNFPPSGEGAQPNSPLDFLGVQPDVKSIVIITLNPNLGDNIIFTYGKIPYLHTRFPTATITVVSPTSSILAESAWLKPVVAPVLDLLSPKAVERSFADLGEIGRTLAVPTLSHIRPDSLVFWDSSSFHRLAEEIYFRILTKYGSDPEKSGSSSAEAFERKVNEVYPVPSGSNARSHLRKMIEEKIRADLRQPLLEKITNGKVGGIGSDVSHRSMQVAFPNGVEPKWKPKVPPRKHVYPLTMKIENVHNAYLQAAVIARSELGADAFMNWSPSVYLNPEKARASLPAILGKAFQEPNAPFIVINLNTRGEMKVEDLRRDYVPRLREILDQISAKHPGVNIFIAPPEAQFGDAVTQPAHELIQGFADRSRAVALLPADRDQWKTVLSRAEAVISQDSGFTHVANVFNENVLTISRDIAGKLYTGAATHWQRPDRASASFGELSPGGPFHAPSILNWLDETLKRNHPHEKNCVSDGLTHLLELN